MSATLPLIRHDGPNAVVAFRRDQPITAERFLGDVAALAAMLPSRGPIMNLCSDRYRFTVGLAAALARGKPSLLPPDDTPATLEQIAADFPDAICLTDGARLALAIPCLTYPQAFAVRRPRGQVVWLDGISAVLSLRGQVDRCATSCRPR